MSKTDQLILRTRDRESLHTLVLSELCYREQKEGFAKAGKLNGWRGKTECLGGSWSAFWPPLREEKLGEFRKQIVFVFFSFLSGFVVLLSRFFLFDGIDNVGINSFELDYSTLFFVLCLFVLLAHFFLHLVYHFIWVLFFLYFLLVLGFYTYPFC